MRAIIDTVQRSSTTQKMGSYPLDEISFLTRHRQALAATEFLFLRVISKIS